MKLVCFGAIITIIPYLKGLYTRFSSVVADALCDLTLVPIISCYIYIFLN